ncbi:hypothetical protein DM01DRAFT_1330740 [Hesseltinella vesiculosa]|uniref:HIT-type domain-containing protein n=1 Tax=Hesseltinella vesiculosa TaxID=101127 RepID=A0A1X2GWZ6_9FUNG|nr:hypothetical protein DM01DRAFT_1330740 [Hesseltinella vesiculosa]
MAVLCSICKEADSRYKCSTCRIAYCSLACYKTHKETPCESPEPKSDLHTTLPQDQKWRLPKKSDYDDPQDETLTRLDLTQLQQLESNDHILSLLANPDIRQYIKAIENSSTPDKLLQEIRDNDATFGEFVVTLLNATGASKH